MKDDDLATVYLRVGVRELNTLLERQLPQIRQAGHMLADTWASGGCLFASHTNHVLTTELANRAGGPVRMLALDHGGTPGNMDSPGLVDVQAGDLILIHSNCGSGAREGSIVAHARHLGAKTVALTQVVYEQSALVSSNHSSGRMLHELADATIDIGGVVGDAAIRVLGCETPICPTSGLTGVAAAWAIVAAAAEVLTGRGQTTPFFRSAQMPGAKRQGERKRAERDSWLAQRRLIPRPSMGCGRIS